LPTDGLSPPSESDRLLGLRYSNSDSNARPMSGEPVAVHDEPAPQAAALPALPAPESAPVAPVAAAEVPTAAVASVPAAPPPALPAAEDRVAAPPPAEPAVKTEISLNPAKAPSGKLSPESRAPFGPGGFILE
jgi:hypothetical protein